MSRIIIPSLNPPLANFPGGWSLYRWAAAAPSASFLWPEFKLVNSGPRRWGGVRVYRLAWSPIHSRLRRDSQRKLLAAREPELAAQLQLWLELHRDRSWLAEQWTVAEIEEEARRISTSGGPLAST